MSRARTLSAWVGTGKAVTANGVLGRADVGPAVGALGLPEPGWVRTAADVEAIHRPWVAAQAAGLLTVGIDRAVATTPETCDPTEQWLAGLRAVLLAESHDQRRVGARVLCRAVLHVLNAGAVPDAHHLEHTVEDILARMDYTEAGPAYEAFRRGVTPVPAGLALLAECGAVDADTMTVTPLGHWAQRQLADHVEPSTPTAVQAHHICQLKVGLRHVRPAVWRRVLVPALTDLGLLHRIIQIVLAWDDDHLHVFTADGRRYADPDHELEDCADEDTATLAALFPRPGASIDYRYDLGDCWDHTITLEKILERDDGLVYPSCLGGRGDAPVEDWAPDCPEESIPFDRELLNEQLATLTASGRR